jgi:hypothetical protein
MAAVRKSRITFSYEGIGEMLRSEFMEAEMGRRINNVKDRAVATSPVGSAATRDTHPGRYKDAFETETTREGGVNKDRASGYLVNTSPEAFIVEYGTSRQRAFATMRNALDAARD